MNVDMNGHWNLTKMVFLMVMVVHHALIVVLDVAFRQVIMVISNAILVVMSFVNMVMAGFI